MTLRHVHCVAALAWAAACVVQAADAAAVPAVPAAAVCDGSSGYAAAFDGRGTFLWQPARLRQAQAQIANGGLQAANAQLLQAAQKALQVRPYSVVDKRRAPASGDLHDYTSMGPYWWPDPDAPDGRPYIRRDGQFNPERDGDAFDLTRLENMSQDVQALALAYTFTGEKAYADKAAGLIRVWFLDPKMRMNPNFANAQSIPGKVAGRAEGVIDAHRLSRVIEAIGLLASSRTLSEQDMAGLKTWFGELVDWMQTSDIGKAERAKTNNHGLYYDMLLSHFALFAGKPDVARATIAAAGQQRLTPQIDDKGAMPQELARTRSMHYTTWTLTAMMDLADLGRCVGVDLWNYPTAERPLLRSAVDFLVPHVGKEQAWPWPELDKGENEGIHEVLIRAGWAWNSPQYLARAQVYSRRYAALPLNLLLPAFPQPGTQ